MAKRYKEPFGNIKKELGNYKLSVLISYILNQALLRLYQISSTKEGKTKAAEMVEKITNFN